MKAVLGDRGLSDARVEFAFDQLRLFLKDEAQLICHVDLFKKLPDGRRVIEALLGDTHYRNQFETGTSGGFKFKAKDAEEVYSPGNQRFLWESKAFFGMYDATRVPFLRPKYGCMNFFMDRQGIEKAHQYGTSYMVLRGVRERVTVSSDDTSEKQVETSTPAHMLHVLDKFTDEELSAAIAIALKEKDTAPSKISNKYKEIQIHGELRLDEHVAVLVVPHKALTEEGSDMSAEERGRLVEGFCTKFGCAKFVSGKPGSTAEGDSAALRRLCAETRAPPQALKVAGSIVARESGMLGET
jgi:hypothetical protein